MKKAANILRIIAAALLGVSLLGYIKTLGLFLFTLVPIVGWAVGIFVGLVLIVLFPITLISIYCFVVPLISGIALLKNKNSVVICVLLGIFVLLTFRLIAIVAAVCALISLILSKKAAKKEELETVEE